MRKPAGQPAREDPQSEIPATSPVEAQRHHLARLIGRLLAMRWLDREGIVNQSGNRPPSRGSQSKGE